MEVNQQDNGEGETQQETVMHALLPMDYEDRCKQLEAKIEPLMRTLEGFNVNRYNGKHRYRRRRALERQRCKVKREVANFWKELIVLKQESRRNPGKRWSVIKEVKNLFTVALKLSYPEFKDIQKDPDVVFSVREYGEYHCEDVLEIWPRLREKGKAHLGPRSVGYQIKKNLQVQQSEIIQQGLDIGFVTFFLSGKWMAKSLHKLLRDGVDTWAPLLFLKNYLVNIYFPTCDVADLSDMDLLRRELIKKTLINILEFCKVDHWCSSMPCRMDLPQEESDKFRTMICDEDVLIFPNAEGQHEPLIQAKRGSSDPLIDLKNLWYGLKKKRADWIVCLTPVHQREYIEMCFSAAEHAKWLPADRIGLPRSSYTGYQSCNTSMEDLVAKVEDLGSFLGKMEAKVSEAGYTIEQVLNCAVKYTLLKNHRLAVCTSSFEEILNEEGDTFVYLLNTHVRNRSFTKEHCKDIEELKNASELTLGEDEIWEKGEERVLALHLLEFTQAIELSCYPVLPHKLCKYLYDLSVRFNSYCDSWEDGIAETKLLLCKATEVVMEKCFHILGITPESSYLGDKQESLGLPKSLLQVGRMNHRDPPPNSRFQLFSVYIHITKDPTLRECMLFGKINISDTYGVLYDGWGLPYAPDGGTVALFHCDRHDQIRVTNHRGLKLGNLSSSHLVPLSSSMEISTELYATTLKEDALFPLSIAYEEMDFTDFLKLESGTERETLFFKSDYGHVRMYYVLLRDAVDCAIEVRYDFNEDREVHADIYAFYGSNFFDKNEDPFAKNFYTASLYEGLIAGKDGEVPLKRSMMAVPANGSIVIKARLYDYDKDHGYLDEDFIFDAQPGNGCRKEMRGSCGCCSLTVSVVWSQD